MYIHTKPLSRRTVLRGLGATVALPFLDAMVPTRRAWAQGRATGATRTVFIEMVHGAAGSSAYGSTKNLWSPADTGRDFDLTPTALSSLEPFRDHLTIISNTDVAQAEAYAPPLVLRQFELRRLFEDAMRELVRLRLDVPCGFELEPLEIIVLLWPRKHIWAGDDYEDEREGGESE